MIEHQDVDAYRDALASWDMHAIPLERGQFQLRWILRELPDISLVRYSTATSIREEYVKEPGATAFVIMLPSETAPFRVNGAELEPMTLTMLHSDTPYEVISPTRPEALEIYVPDGLLDSFGLDRWLDPGTINVRPDLETAQRLRSRLEPLVSVGVGSQVHRDGERAAILDDLAAALDSVDESTPPPATARMHAVYRRALAAIEADPDPMLTVIELASRLGVTARTLRYAFGYGVGVSPYQFMLCRRLSMVRDALLDPTRPECTVLDLLMAHGITHQGEFAGQ